MEFRLSLGSRTVDGSYGGEELKLKIRSLGGAGIRIRRSLVQINAQKGGLTADVGHICFDGLWD